MVQKNKDRGLPEPGPSINRTNALTNTYTTCRIQLINAAIDILNLNNGAVRLVVLRRMNATTRRARSMDRNHKSMVDPPKEKMLRMGINEQCSFDVALKWTVPLTTEHGYVEFDGLNGVAPMMDVNS